MMTSITRSATAAIDNPSVPVSSLVSPPEQVRHFVVRPGEGPGTWIAYENHPAYASLIATASIASKAAALAGYSKYFAMILCKRLISYELIPAHLRKSGSLRGTCQFLRAGFENAMRKLMRKVSGPAVAGGLVQATLERDGVCVAPIDDQPINRIMKAAAPLLAQLRQARGECASGGRDFAESRKMALRTANSELFAAVEDMLQRSGILDGCSAYIGHPARLVDCIPQINDPSDDFWRRIFPDLADEPRPGAYFHRDASGGDIKAIIYLSDVGPKNGPFSYAIGSNQLRSSSLINWIEEANDQSGYSSTKLDARQRFTALPAALRRKCAFGNDLLPNTEITDRILQSEWTIQATKGHIVLFDTKGFHRGGMVTDGERIVLTCVIGSVYR